MLTPIRFMYKNHLVMIYEKSNFNDFQKFLTEHAQDYKTDNEYRDEIINILIKILSK